MAKIELPAIPTGPDRPVVLVRTYPGHHQVALELFQLDAEALAEHGDRPVGQSDSEGRDSPGLVTLATILAFVGIGLAMLISMAAVRPPGTLGATFVLPVSRAR